MFKKPKKNFQPKKHLKIFNKKLFILIKIAL